MNKKIIIAVLSAVVAAATAIIQVLSSCSTFTKFEKKTPADSVYYERSISFDRQG